MKEAEEIAYVSFIEPVKIKTGLARHVQGEGIHWHQRGIRVGSTVIPMQNVAWILLKPQANDTAAKDPLVSA